MNPSGIALFALGGSAHLGRRVADALGVAPARHEERDFEDGEHKARPLESVRGCDVYVLQQFHADPGQSVDDRLMRLLFFLAALRDAHAGRVTAVIPYLAYGRKDRRTKPRDPVTTRYLAQLLEAIGVDRVVSMDVHNPAAFENAFRIPVDHLEARPLFVRRILDSGDPGELVIVSPDAGGYKRAERLRELVAAESGVTPGIAFLEKKRSEGVLSGNTIVGEVSGRRAVIVDDLVSTGSTLARAADACTAAGCLSVEAVATHGLFTGAANDILGRSALERLVITNAVPAEPSGAALRDKLSVIDCGPMMAEAIGRLHENRSLTEWAGTDWAGRR